MTITLSSANRDLWKTLTQDGQVSRADMEAVQKALASEKPDSSPDEIRQAMVELLQDDSGDPAYADRLLSQFEQGQLTSPETYQRHPMAATEVSFEVSGAQLQDSNGIRSSANNDLSGSIEQTNVHIAMDRDKVASMVEQFKPILEETLKKTFSQQSVDAILSNLEVKQVQKDNKTTYEISVNPDAVAQFTNGDWLKLGAGNVFGYGDLTSEPLLSIQSNEQGELQVKAGGIAASVLNEDELVPVETPAVPAEPLSIPPDTQQPTGRTQFEAMVEDQAHDMGLDVDVVREGDNYTLKPKSLTLKGEKLQAFLKDYPDMAHLANGELILTPEQFKVTLGPEGLDIQLNQTQITGGSDSSTAAALPNADGEGSTRLEIESAKGNASILRSGEVSEMSLTELNGALKGDITLSSEVLNQIQQKVKENLTHLDQKLANYGLSREQLSQLMSQIPMDSLQQLVSSAKSGDVEKLAKEYGVDGKSLSSALEFLRQEPVQQIIQDLNTLSEHLAVNTRLEGGVEFTLSDLKLQSSDQGFLATLGSLQLTAQAQATTPGGLTTELDLTAQTENVAVEGNSTGVTTTAGASSVSIAGQTPDGETLSATASHESAYVGPDSVSIQSPELSTTASVTDSEHATRLDASIRADQIDATNGNLTVDGAQATADMHVTEPDGTQTEASAELSAAQITASATPTAPAEDQQVRDFMMDLTKPASPYIEADGPRKNYLKDKPISAGGLYEISGLTKETALKELSKATAKEWAEIVHQSKDAQERFFKEREIKHGTYLSDYLNKYVLQPDASGLNATDVSSQAAVSTRTEGIEPVDARISGSFDRIHAGEQGASAEDAALAIDVTAGTTSVHVETAGVDIQANPDGLDAQADVNWDVNTAGEQGRISGKGTTTVGIEDSQVTGTRTKKGAAQISIEASRQQLIELIAQKNPELAEYIRKNNLLGKKEVDIQIENTRDIVTDANGNLSQYEVRASLPSINTPYGHTAASIFVSDNGSITGDILLNPNAKFESLIEARLKDVLKPEEGEKQEVFLKDVKIEGGKLKIQLEGKKPVSLDLDLSVTTLPNGKIHIGVDQVKLQNKLLDLLASGLLDNKAKARETLMAKLIDETSMQVTPDGKYGLVIDANEILQDQLGPAASGVRITPTLDEKGNLNIRYNIG